MALEGAMDKATPEGRMTMMDYPRGEEKTLALRKKINDLIKERKKRNNTCWMAVEKLGSFCYC